MVGAPRASTPTAGRVLHLAPAVVLATGGLGQLYLHTTNPDEATGDGLAMAARAGARLVDLEFVQFHPTALATGADPMPLLTEALRGEGAVLIDDAGPALHARRAPGRRAGAARRGGAGDLAPADGRRMASSSTPARRWARSSRSTSRPSSSSARSTGSIRGSQPIPVAPAAHYHMGGIAVDDDGRTSLPGLWACGEVAVDRRPRRQPAGQQLAAGGAGLRRPRGGRPALQRLRRRARLRAAGWPAAPPRASAAPGDAELTAAVRRLMWEKVGLVRDEAGLAAAVAELRRLAAAHPQAPERRGTSSRSAGWSPRRRWSGGRAGAATTAPTSRRAIPPGSGGCS